MKNQVEEIRPLVIGTGLAGKRHLNAQLQLGINTGVYNPNPESTKQFMSQAGVIVFENFKDALRWSNLVHVCTPDNLHTEYVAESIRANKVVLCEKPITTSLDEALELNTLACQFQSVVIIGHNYRLTPTFMETRKRVLQGEIGVITGIETTYLHDMAEYRFGTKWRNIQDFLYVDGSHAVDLASWVVNEKITMVQAMVGTRIRPEYNCHERYQIICQFESGFLGHIHLDSSSARAVNGTDLVVEGELGYLSSHNKIDALSTFTKGDREIKTIVLPNKATLTTALEVKIVDDFLTGKRHSCWPLSELDEGVNTIKVLSVIQKSVISGAKETVIY